MNFRVFEFLRSASVNELSFTNGFLMVKLPAIPNDSEERRQNYRLNFKAKKTECYLSSKKMVNGQKLNDSQLRESKRSLKYLFVLHFLKMELLSLI